MEAYAQPETYSVKRTAYCPSNHLPVLIYRGVLGDSIDEETASDKLQRHGWVKKGTWGTIKLKHFHPNTHECYGIFQGSSELVFGEGTSDPKGSGVTCNVKAGDVVVVPAGVAHASTPEAKEDTEAEYRYIGVYPEDSPHYRSELGKKDLEEKAGLIEEVAAVPVPPQDPLYGRSGPLVTIWKSATGNSVE